MKNPAKLFPLTLMNKSLAIAWGNAANSTRPWTMACLLLATSPVFAGVQTPENTKWIGTSPSQEDIDQFKFTPEQIKNQIDEDGFGSLRFGVTDRNIWGANQTSTSIDYSLTSSQWNSVFGRPPTARLGVGGIAEVCVPLLPCIKAGAAAGIELETYVLPYLKMEFDPGTFDAKVEYAPSVVYQSEGLGVDFSKLDTKSNLVDSKSEFRLDAPSLFLETGVNIEANVNLFAEACLLGCFLDETFNLYSTDFKVPLIKLDTGSGEKPGSEATFIVFNPNPDEVLVNIGNLIANPGGELIETFKDSLYTDATPLLVGTVDGKLSEQLSEENQKKWQDAKDSISSAPISVGFSLPFSEDDGASVGFSGGTASKSIGGELLSLQLDLDQVLGYAFGLKDGAKFSLDQFGVDTGPVTGSIELGDAKVGPVIELKTDVSLSPELMVNLKFDNEVRIRGQIGKQTSYDGKWDDLPEIALSAESNILGVNENVNDKTVSATPTFSVNANVSNHTYLDLKAKATIDLLSVEIDIKGDGLPGLEFGPVLSYEAKSSSLYQVDLFKDTFAVNNWNALSTNADGVESETAQQGIAGKALTFNAFGEIIFQARAEGGSSDSFYDNDDRIDVNLSTSKVLAAQRTKHQSNLYDNSSNSIQQLAAGDTVVQDSIFNELKIANLSAAHVMQDGLFTNAGGKTFTVEAGGGLELGKDNNYKVRSLASEGLAGQQSTVAGVINNGKLQIFGDVYSNAGVENDGHKFINAASGSNGTPSLLVGASGWLKFDGQFINEGFINNYGAIELTEENNKSSNFFANFYGGEIDLHGSLSLERKEFESLNNAGTLRVFAGGELEVERTQQRQFTNYVDVNNTGNLVIDAGGELRMTQSTANSAGTELLNVGTVSNSGYVLNDVGQTISNGTKDVNFTTLFGANGDWRNSNAMALRSTDLAATEAAQQLFLDENKKMETAAQVNANDRVMWIDSEANKNRAERTQVYVESTHALNDFRKSGGTVDVAAKVVQNLVVAMTSDGFGVWENESGSLLVNEGNIENNAVMVNHVGANTYNSGALDNNGYLLNTGQLINNKGPEQNPAVLSNMGRLENGTEQIGLANISETTNLGRIENSGELVNHDTLVNFGSINSVDDGSGKTARTRIENNGSLSNLGQLSNNAAMTNAQGAEVNNYATITNTGVIDNHGFFNNGVKGSAIGQSDIAGQGQAAQDFYASIQSLQNANQTLQNVNQKYNNELARQSANGFKGTVNADSSKAWAIHLYEKYLVSNLAANEYSDNYGPQLGSLAKDRDFIRSEVIEYSGNVELKAACATDMLACYKYYYGTRTSGGNIYGDPSSAINYDFSNSAGFARDGTGIQAFSMFNDSNFFEDNQGDMSDENRFEWTMLMMMEAEGLYIGALDCARDNNCRGESYEDWNNGSNQQTRKSYYLSYGLGLATSTNGDDFTPGDINELDALYARWTDEVFFKSSAYESKGIALALTDVGAHSNAAAADLVKFYKAMYSKGNTSTPSGLIETIQQKIANLPTKDFGDLAASLTDIQSADVVQLINGLGSALDSAGFDLAGITSMDANLDNSGTFNNRGVVNNSSIISNSETGVINNSGVLMIGSTGKIENDGEINLERYVLDTSDSPNGPVDQVQEGLLISNGIINNRGVIDISAGTLVNGTMKNVGVDSELALVNPQTTITNDGSIKLSGQSKVENGQLIVNKALLINNATIVNNGLIEIGAHDSFKVSDENGQFLGNIYSSNTLQNRGNLINQAGSTLSNNGILQNSGLIENQVGGTFTNAGLLNNATSGTITFADAVTLDGFVANNGVISMADDELLTLTGNISGNGTFVGNTLIQGMANDPAKLDTQGKYTATVNPGNSPGLLTFDGDVEAINVNWVMEIWGTERGVSYDGVDILGDFTIAGGMSVTLLALIDFDTLISQDFNFLSVSGNLLNAAGGMIADTFAFVDISASMADSWAGQWIKNISGGWDLNFSFIAENTDLYSDLRSFQAKSVDVPAPGTLSIFLLGLLALGWRVNVRTKNSADS
jgi:hypothetical protein